MFITVGHLSWKGRAISRLDSRLVDAQRHPPMRWLRRCGTLSGEFPSMVTFVPQVIPAR